MIAAVLWRDEDITRNHIPRHRVVTNGILGDHAVLAATAASQRPEEILILGRVGNEDLTLCRDNPHLQNVAGCESIGSRDRPMPAALDVSAESHAGVLACCHNSAFTEGFVKYISPLLAASDNVHVLGGVRCLKTPRWVAF